MFCFLWLSNFQIISLFQALMYQITLALNSFSINSLLGSFHPLKIKGHQFIQGRISLIEKTFGNELLVQLTVHFTLLSFKRLAVRLHQLNFIVYVLTCLHLVETYLWRQIQSTLTKFSLSLGNWAKLGTLSSCPLFAWCLDCMPLVLFLREELIRKMIYRYQIKLFSLIDLVYIVLLLLIFSCETPLPACFHSGQGCLGCIAGQDHAYYAT